MTLDDLRQLEHTAAVTLLRRLPYRDREIAKLLTGLGDGFTYTIEEVSHIFQTTPQEIAKVQKTVEARLEEVPECDSRGPKVEEILGDADDTTLAFDSCHVDIEDDAAVDPTGQEASISDRISRWYEKDSGVWFRTVALSALAAITIDVCVTLYDTVRSFAGQVDHASGVPWTFHTLWEIGFLVLVSWSAVQFGTKATSFFAVAFLGGLASGIVLGSVGKL